MDLLNCIHVSQIDFNLVSKEYFNTWVNYSGLFSGVIFLLLCAPIHICAYQAAKIKCNNFYPNEKVLYVIKNSPIFRSIVTVLVGAFFGTFLLPFFVFKNLDSVRLINQSNKYIFLVAFIISAIFIVVRFCIIFILTDKNIRLICPYRFLDKILKKELFVSYENIKSVEFSRFLNTECLTIRLKNGKFFRGLVGFVKLKNAKKIIEERMEARSTYEYF